MKNFIKRHLPKKDAVRKQKSLGFIGEKLFHEDLWKFNRQSLAKAMAIGLFWTWIPIPFQMIPTAVLAVIFRANIPVSIGAVWLTNPITIGPLYFLGYSLGNFIMNRGSVEMEEFPDELVASSFHEVIFSIWQPMFLGCTLIGIVCSSLGYLAVMFFFRTKVSDSDNLR